MELPDAALRQICAVCGAFGVDGMRADLVTARTAIALAAWGGRDVVTEEDVRIAARLALPHRRRRDPFDAPGLDEQALDDALREAASQDSDAPGDPEDDPDGPGPGGPGPDGPGGIQDGDPAPSDRAPSDRASSDRASSDSASSDSASSDSASSDPGYPLAAAKSQKPRRAHRYHRRPRSAPGC